MCSSDHNVRKINAVLRYSEGEAKEGWSVTGMYYRGLWNATTDQPERAMDPAYMASLGLQPISKYARQASEFVNLYSRFRGVNRWPALLKVFDLLADWDEVRERIGGVWP